MQLFEKKSGTTRRVFLGKHFVFKTSFYLPLDDHRAVIFCEGILANIVELISSRVGEEDTPFVAKTYFSFFGLVNVQRRIRGVAPTAQQMSELTEKFSGKLADQWSQIGAHQRNTDNFLIDEKGKWWVVDYGGSSLRATVPIFPVLYQHHRELCVLFGHKQNDSPIGACFQ